jgi:Ca-activated chloride channel homolog
MRRRQIYANMPYSSLKALLLMLFLLGQSISYAQSSYRREIRAGNRALQQGEYQEAELHYRKALGKGGNKTSGVYNLGGALYRQQQYRDAYDHYRTLFVRKEDSATMNALAYNFGNAAMQLFLHSDAEGPEEEREALLRQSIEAYSQALRYNPSDEDARHNLGLALQFRHEAPPPQSQDQSQHQQDQQKHEQPLPETLLREEERDQHIPEHQEGRISREDAERMLNAIKEKEMQTAEQINERERKRMGQSRDRNW